MRSVKTFRYLLVRQAREDSCFVTLVIHMQKALKNKPEATASDQAFAALKRGIDDWSRNTVVGRRVRDYSHEDTNIGDMADLLDPLEKTLRPFVRLQGIECLEVTGWSQGEVLPYDTRLIYPE